MGDAIMKTLEAAFAEISDNSLKSPAPQTSKVFVHTSYHSGELADQGSA
jgi:hypothetical protein